MPKMTTNYSHAAPYIRALALRAASSAASAKLKRVIAEYMGELNGLIIALEVLLHSPEGRKSPPGIADFDKIPSGWQEIMKRQLSVHGELFPTLQETYA